MESKQEKELKSRIEELVKMKEFVEDQSKIYNEKKWDVTTFCDQTYKILGQIYQSLVDLTSEVDNDKSKGDCSIITNLLGRACGG